MITEGAIRGHWVRRWIKAPGFEDHTTRVHWMQAGRDYADVRIPLMRPDLRGATCLADLPATTLIELCQAEGFAGHVTLQDDRCTWHREVNWHGTPDMADVGTISFDDAGRMIETGVLADYTELWSQNAKAETAAVRFSGGTHTGLLVCSGSEAVVAIGQVEKSSTKPLLAALKTGTIPDHADADFGGIHALCRLRKDTAVATLATNPFAEGQPVLSFEDDHVIWHKLDFDGSQTKIEMKVAHLPA
ncbi:MAG: hypothetical protein AAFR73_10175 [Pseudomonadota bacterium]